MKKIGLLFGSFNPLHNGHVALAELAQHDNLLDEVWFVLQNENSYKPANDFLDYETRKLLIEEAGLTVYQPRTTNYAHFVLETLRELTDYDRTLILGKDLAEHFADWQDYHEIVSLAKVYAAQERIQDVSSGKVRAALQAGSPIAALVPPSVARFLQP